jgi:hypothetical protein
MTISYRKDVMAGLESVRTAEVRTGLTYAAILCILATAVMIPRLSAARFGLLDDGVTIFVSRNLTTSLRDGDYGSLLGIEPERGRFRPLYFLYYAVQYAAWGAQPQAFFVTQWLSLIFTAMLISGIAAMAAGNRLAALLSGVAYILSGPTIESYYTLSKGEPPVVMWLALSVFFLVASLKALGSGIGRALWWFVASLPPLALAYFTKETAQAMVLVTGMWAGAAFLHERGRTDRPIACLTILYFVANLAIASGYWGTRVLSGTAAVPIGSDSGHYEVALAATVSSVPKYLIWCVRDFPFLAPLLAFLAVVFFTSRRTKLAHEWRVVLGSVIWIAGWTLIMLPWHTALEYYLLPATLGTSVLTGVALSALLGCLRSGSAALRAATSIILFLVLFLALITVVNAATNGRIQVTVDVANARLIDYLAQSVPQDGSVLVHAHGPSEYVFEMGLHLALLKDRGDIIIEYFSESAEAASPEAFVVTPVIQNQPLPSARIGVWEGDVVGDRPEFLKQLGDSSELVWRGVDEVRLLILSLDDPICRALTRMASEGDDLGWCRFERPFIDTRVFEYGWEVYRR